MRKIGVDHNIVVLQGMFGLLGCDNEGIVCRRGE